MLNRLTVSALLRAAILAAALIIIGGIWLSAWEAWQRLQLANRMTVVAEISADLFKAMSKMRTDMSTTNRQLNADHMDSDVETYLRGLRDAEMPAMSSGLALLARAEFAQQGAQVAEFDRLLKTLTAQQSEFWDEVRKPKAARRLALAKEYVTTVQGLLDTLDAISGSLAAAVDHQDATIDQLLAIKQDAWLLRNTAGEASLIVSTSLNAGQITPAARQNYTKLVGGSETAWKALELITASMQLPPELSGAMAAAKTAYFEPDYLALRDRLIATVASGEKAELTANQFTPLTVGRMSTAVKVAETALDAAKAHSAEQSSTALHSLIMQLGLLAGAIALTFGAMTMVGRRVITPLVTIRDAMLKVAGGDLTVSTGYGERQDEIGALAGALETFKQQAE
ncbi:HAMP domain-containing protein, partial [Bradyrhizobium sp.]|uniref:HAMP domain-containing protein n=1 Tax=Bradyrhizobium sp. TaxID=376 RepID=UPI003C56B968